MSKEKKEKQQQLSMLRIQAKAKPAKEKKKHNPRQEGDLVPCRYCGYTMRLKAAWGMDKHPTLVDVCTPCDRKNAEQLRQRMSQSNQVDPRQQGQQQ